MDLSTLGIQQFTKVAIRNLQLLLGDLHVLLEGLYRSNIEKLEWDFLCNELSPVYELSSEEDSLKLNWASL